MTGRAVVWTGLYLALVLAPLTLLLFIATPPKGGFWWEVAIGCGFAALSMLVLHFFLTARLRIATAPFGIDVIYYFHRWLAYVLLVMILLHPLVLLWLDGSLWTHLRQDRNWSLQSGLWSLLCMLVVVFTSAFRKPLRLAYHHWRRLHLVLALAAVGFGFAHLHAVSYYSAAPLAQGLWQLMALALVLLILHVHLLRPWLLLRKPWIVSEVRMEQGDCCSLTLEPEGHKGFDFKPGQFGWLSLGHTPFSLQEHPFSFASAPRADGAVVFTIKALGDFTSTLGLHNLGQRAWVDAPYGRFSCDLYPQAPGYVFIAGGIGVAPVLSMLEALAARGDRRHHLLFAAHSRYDRIPRRHDLVALSQQLQLKPVPVLETPPPDWNGYSGWITGEILARHLTPDFHRHQCFICGPKPMLRAMERMLRELGIPAANIHSELFDMV
ncbi:MAG: ferredoxin reductase family protein [Pseudomonadales bacterium]|nr:ferredoxin reductase family protein [Pseudomonadales bacterium]